MIRATLLTPGKIREPWLREGIADYEQRLSHRIHLEWKWYDSEKEILPSLGKARFIALDPRGTLVDSPQFSALLHTKWGARPLFVVGPPQGLSQDVLEKSLFCWSLSPLTFTHTMAQLLLLEQLYRASEIEHNTPYHK